MRPVIVDIVTPPKAENTAMISDIELCICLGKELKLTELTVVLLGAKRISIIF